MTEESHSDWEASALQKVLLESIKEQRSNRRWKIFFRLIFILIFLMFIAMLKPSHSSDYYKRSKPHVAEISVYGTIAPGAKANAESIIDDLKDAFKSENVTAVMLLIDSPGGSPVQAGEVYDEITYLKSKHPKIPVYAVCTDVCASGAYYIAAAADKIYADKASFVGSIGVLMNGFGFVDTLEKLGIQRRLMTSGKYKGFMDPFSPINKIDEAYMQKMLNIVHEQFIASVKAGRGSRLQQDPNLFSGLVWTGQQALPLGLIDGIATPQAVLRDVIKNETVVDYTSGESLLKRLSGSVGSSAAHTFAHEMGLDKGVHLS